MNQQIATILQALDFMEAHLREEIAIADIAAAVNYSLYHFVRTFNRFTQHTPYDYLIRRRLSQAAQELVHGRRKIITLALDYRFHSTEVFARAFKRMFGLQPSEYRARQQADTRFLLVPRNQAHLEYLQQGLLPPRQEQWPACSLAGLMIRQPTKGKTISLKEGLPEEHLALWRCLQQALNDSIHARQPLAFYGITLYPTGWEKGGAFYLAAAALPDAQAAPAAWINYPLPAGTYARFQHPGEIAGLPLARDCIYQTWLPHSGWQLAQPIDIEYYGPALPTSECKPAIYLPVCRA